MKYKIFLATTSMALVAGFCGGVATNRKKLNAARSLNKEASIIMRKQEALINTMLDIANGTPPEEAVEKLKMEIAFIDITTQK